MIDYKTVVARHGQTWDSIAYENYGDGMEFFYPSIMQENRQYSRTLSFNGGESVIVPLGNDAPVVMSSGTPETQTPITIISTPWG